jgi:hypothetical protein
MCRAFSACLGLLALALLPGCGQQSATVSGSVTYDGEPVASGMVTLQPADGKGPTAGGPIVNGRYKVENVKPGPKVVRVEAVKAVPFARSSEEMARRAAENKARGDGTGIIDRADVIPADAEGNNALVELRPGSQEHDLHLKKPGGARAR